jgi:hypothetical protein
MTFTKEKSFGNDNVYRIHQPTRTLRCTAHTALYSPENGTSRARFLDLRLSINDEFDTVALETRVCQDLFPHHTLCYPFDVRRRVLPHVKVPTHYGHIQIPIVDQHGARANSHEITEGTALLVEIQPKSAWSLERHCGISWTLHAIKVLPSKDF